MNYDDVRRTGQICGKCASKIKAAVKYRDDHIDLPPKNARQRRAASDGEDDPVKNVLQPSKPADARGSKNRKCDMLARQEFVVP
jgi:hypothetical protein